MKALITTENKFYEEILLLFTDEYINTSEILTFSWKKSFLDFENELQTVSLFSSSKVYVVEKFDINTHKDKLSLLTSCEVPIIVFSNNKIDKRTTVGKELNKYFQVFSKTEDFIEYILSKHKLKASKYEMNQLSAIYEKKYIILNNILKKNKYKNVQQLLQNNEETSIFILSNYFFQQKMELFFTTVSNLSLDQQQILFSHITNQLRLLTIIVLSVKQFSIDVIAEKLKIHPYRCKMIYTDNKYTYTQLTFLYNLFITSDYLYKIGVVDRAQYIRQELTKENKKTC